MIGPPGTGKTMLAQRMAGVLPPLGRSESLETTRIYSAMGLLPDGVALMDQRPVRTPHHSATAQALGWGRRDSASPGKFATWRIMGFYFWMSCRNLIGMFWKHCGSPWRPGM